MPINFEPDNENYDKAWVEQKLCFTQHRAWGEAKSNAYKPHFLLVDDRALAIHARSLPVVKGIYGYSPRAFNSENIPNAVDLARAASDICQQMELTHLVFEPNVIQLDDNPIDSYLSAGFAINEDTIQPRHSRLIDLTKSDEQLKAEMTKDVRRRIKRGEDDGYKFSEDSSENGLNEFYAGLSEVAKRAKFDIQSKNYFELIFRSLPPDMAHIYLCHSLRGDLLYAMFSIKDGEAFRRIYGGPTLHGRQGDAAQFTAWQAIKAAQALGSTKMDLWGVAPYDNEGNFEEGHPLSGVSKFKATLGGENVTYLPQLIWVRDKARFTAYRQLTRAYRATKRIKRGLS